MNAKTRCLFCNKDFEKTHGNQVYCSATCKRMQKANTQAKLYGILKEFRKGYLANYKLFEKLQAKPGTKNMLLSDINNMGFKPNCYYGIFTDSNGKHWYKIDNYSFSVANKDHVLSITIVNK